MISARVLIYHRCPLANRAIRRLAVCGAYGHSARPIHRLAERGVDDSVALLHCTMSSEWLELYKSSMTRPNGTHVG